VGVRNLSRSAHALADSSSGTEKKEKGGNRWSLDIVTHNIVGRGCRGDGVDRSGSVEISGQLLHSGQ
jgi:hypothetical protein